MVKWTVLFVKCTSVVPFNSRCNKMSTLSHHSDGVSHTAALKRKHEADSAKNVVTNAFSEIKDLLKTTHFTAEKQANLVKFSHMDKLIKELNTDMSNYGNCMRKVHQSCTGYVENVDKDVLKSPVCCLVADLPTDRRNRKQ